MNPLRVAIVGCGKIADQHAQQIRRVPIGELVAVCDREALMAGQLAERCPGVKPFDDVDRLLTEARPDVVHITTPPNSHHGLARRCLEAGTHVYVEKPFTVDLREASDLISLVERRRLKLTVGHNVQFSPEMLRMRRLVRDGALGGSPVHMESFFSYDLGDASYAKALLGDKEHWVRRLPGKLLQNLISHGVAKIAEFLDASELTVQAHGYASPLLRSAGEKEIVDELRVMVSDNQRATAYFTFTTQVRPAVQEFRLFGPNGALIIDNMHRTVVRLGRDNAEMKSYLNFFLPPRKLARQYVRNMWANVASFLRADFHMDAGMKNLMEAFYLSIRQDSPPPIPYREILFTAALMEEIFRQLDLAPPASRTAFGHSEPPMAMSGERL